MNNRKIVILFTLTIFAYCFACQRNTTTTIKVHDASLTPISFSYALLKTPYHPNDSTTLLHFLPCDTTELQLTLAEPTFIALRTQQKQETLLLLLAPNEKVELTLQPILYTVRGSKQSQQVLALLNTFKHFNDSLAILKHEYEWDYDPLSTTQRQTQILIDLQNLVSHTHDALLGFIAQEPLSKANLLAFSARYNDSVRFFASASDSSLIQDITMQMLEIYNDTLLIAKIHREFSTPNDH
ncbi:MAG: hypothetical protein ACTTKZ_07120 [Bacteroides sp.]